MSYRLDLELPIGQAARSVAIEQLRDAAAGLREARSHEQAAEAVHNARKDLKKTRSLLRLVRSGLPADAYCRDNRALRDIARSLSDARDGAVLVETLDGLSERLVGLLPEQAVAGLRERLAEQGGSQSSGALRRAAASELQAAADQAKTWPLDRCDEVTLHADIQRTYARGRRAFATTQDEPTVTRLHDLRKRVKDLWHHQRLLAQAWPGTLDAMARESHRLSDLLGDDRDLALLAAVLREAGGPASRIPADDDPLRELVAERRGELRAQAMDLAARVYAEKPKAYGRRLSAYLHEARSGEAAAVVTPSGRSPHHPTSRQEELTHGL